ncbi:MAG TPA: S8 family serine peptidase [Nitrospiria bacterium]
MKIFIHKDRFIKSGFTMGLILIFLNLLLVTSSSKTYAMMDQTGSGNGSQGRAENIQLVDNYLPNEVLVKFKEEKNLSVVEKRQFHDEADTEVLSTISGLKVERVRSKKGETVEELMNRYRQNPFVEYVEPNGLFQIQLTPNDTRFSELYGMHNTGQTGGTVDADIDTPEAWDIQTGTGTIIVADIDTGVDYNHSDLAANMWTNSGEIPNNGIDDDGNGFVDDYRGWDFVSNDNNPMDDHGHGTHTSGTVAAVGNNGIGVAGVTWNAQIMPVKFLNASGGGTFAAGAAAIIYAADMGAHISSNSWGCGPSSGCFSQVVEDAIAYANTKGMLFIVAAGNSNNNNDGTIFYPCTANQPNVICVAATDHNDQKAGFSNYGATTVDLGAPGVNTLSTTPNNTYSVFSGTSMATPHVAGAAALLLSHSPSLTVDQVRSALFNHVDLIPSMAGRTVTGGRLNVDKAIRSLDFTPPTVAITQPIDGDLIRGTATLEASASDNVAVGQVEFYLDPDSNNFLLCIDNASPYQCSLDTTLLSDGLYTLQAVAKDTSNNIGTSNLITVRVDNTPPTVSISFPSEGSTHSGFVLITASANDSNGIGSVQFFIDTNSQCVDTSSPFECSWDTSTFLDGVHTLAAKTFDLAGNTAVSLPVTVTISNQGSPGTGNISTLAGNGINSFCGDGDLAPLACLRQPEGVAMDYEGNVYIADSRNHRIRKVDTDGTITTYAGNGNRGYSGDGGPADLARLRFPSGVAVDIAGNLYIADTGNHRIRKVDTEGIISTIAGTGSGGFNGDGGPATSARLDEPNDVFVDGSGNVYIADTGNQRIRRVDSSGTISTIAGIGNRGFSGDGGPATNARLNNPRGVSLDSLGNLYIADSNNDRIRIVSSSGIIDTYAGTGNSGFSGDGGPAILAQLHQPRGVASLISGEILIGDRQNNRIRLVDLSGNISTVAGNGVPGFSGDGGDATQAQINLPRGVAITGNGFLIADTENSRVRQVTVAPTGDITPPTVSITSPNNGDTVFSTVTVSATASDNVGVSKLEFYLDDVLQSTVYVSPLTWDWNTTTGSNGSFALTAKAYDGAGNVGTSLPVTVIVRNGPDLVVPDLSDPPASVNAGASFVASSTTTNQGTEPTGIFTVGYFLSTDPIISIGDISIGSRTIYGLLPDEGHTGSDSLTVPATVAFGTYYFGVCTDIGNTVTESDETNNCRVASGTIQITQPDLVETSISNPPVSVPIGGNFSVMDTVANQGDGPGNNITIQFYLSPDSEIVPSSDPGITASDILLSGNRTVSILPAGQTSTGTTTVTVPTTVPMGTYYFGACADSPDVETKKTNNCLTAASQVTITGPDLVMTGVSTSTTSVPIGGSFTLADTVKNQGTTTTSSIFYVGLYLSADAMITTADTRLNTRYIGGLAAGVSSSGNSTMTIPTNMAPGTYYIGAIADFDNRQPESDETNNALAGTTIEITP